MAYNKILCPTCCIEKDTVSTALLKGKEPVKQIIHLKCGHVIIKDFVKSTVQILNELVLEDGRKPYPFQIEGVEFAEKSNFRCGIFDEMGLGKTIQAVLSLRIHPELLPAIVICKGSLTVQWRRALLDWADIMSYTMTNGKESISHLPKKLQCVVVSVALLRKLDLTDWNYKTVIIDECQTVKNHLAKQSKAVQEVCKKAEHVIALSGTPIKNNAAEYFNILNILKPERFFNYQHYLSTFVETHKVGRFYKFRGIKDNAINLFRQRTQDFIIRRKRSEVLPDLPQITRNFSYYELGEQVEKAYKQEMTEFLNLYEDGKPVSHEKQQSLIAKIQRLYYLTGLAKTKPAIDEVEEFIDSTDRKILLFAEHQDVINGLEMGCKELCKERGIPDPLVYRASLNDEQRAKMDIEFKDSDCRIMICSMKAGGEGRNLQFCSDMKIVERQWNPANEEQVECRIVRIGQESSKLNADYLIAEETIDEMFAKIVEEKREYIAKCLASGMTEEEIPKWNEQGLMKELMERLAAKAKKELYKVKF